MRYLSIGVTGSSRFSSKILVALYELGHSVFVITPCQGDLKEVAASLGVNELTVEQAVTQKLDGIIASSGRPSIGSATTLCFELHHDTLKTGWQGEMAWVVFGAGCDKLLAHSEFDHGNLLCGADVANYIEERALSLLTAVINSTAKNNGQWPDGRQYVATSLATTSIDQIATQHQSNRTFYSVPEEKSLIAVFLRIADRYPERAALSDGQNSVTYAKLARDAKIISRYLLSHLVRCTKGSTSQPLIGIVMPKSIELYTSIFGVLGAGAAYVPIDPSFPVERIVTIARDADIDLMLCSTDNDLALAAAGLPVLKLTDDCWLDSDGEIPALMPMTTSESLATVIYTSGSTGGPKGVMLEQRNILAFSHWYQRHVCLDEQSRALQFSTVAFDASILDIFPVLLCGGCLVVPSEAERHDFAALDEKIRNEQVSHAFLPPALLAALPDYEWPLLRHLVTGGDVCDPDTIARWRPGRNFHNIYGPTECTVLATTSNFAVHDDNRNIGLPIANVRCYVLNELLQPCCSDEIGELYIAGAGVGRGYCGNDLLTRERFLPDLLDPERRMYRTGDSVFWRTDGQLQFIGRKDLQVKIRGFRVELGEIENALLSLQLYKHCAVVIDGTNNIRACVAAPYSTEANADLVRTGMAQLLPQYMLPKQIVVLDSLPSTVNGKIDRKALISLEVNQNLGAAPDDEKLTPTENELREIWAEVLGLAPHEIGREESFFNLGGHSLLVSKMLLAVKKRWTASATLARFMEQPNLSALALLLTDGSLKKGDQISADVYADMLLPESVQLLDTVNPAMTSPRIVLLTGATGFLGTFLLQQLLESTEAHVYCLVRGANILEANQRLTTALVENGLEVLVGSTRIEVVLGDLAMPGLGLEEMLYERLAIEVDAVYHNGANVNHILDYRALYNANVRSTLDVLRFATLNKNKAVHYVSTLSAASNTDANGRLIESGPALTPPVFVNNGYNLSKWVSEHLMWEAIRRGLTGTIVRPGNISGHSASGVCQPEQNRIMLLIKGSLQVGVIPGWDFGFDLCPVDFLAKGMVRCSLDPNRQSNVLHFHNPSPLSWLDFVGYLQDFGYPLRVVTPDAWRTKIITVDESNALYNVLSFYLDDDNEDIGDMSHIDHASTKRNLCQVGLCYPIKDRNLIFTNLRYLVQCGFLPDPNIRSNEFIESAPFLA